MPLSAPELWQYKLSFDVKVRRAQGIAFQDFFSEVACRHYGADFVQVRPFGSIGDKGCDGYLASSGRVFQCFGKTEDAPVVVATLLNKVKSDYASAKAKLAKIMREWHFVHNLVSGVPVPLVELIEQMQIDHAPHVFGQIGPTALEAMVLALDGVHLLALLGPVATANDSAHMRLEAVAELVNTLLTSIDSVPFTAGHVHTVPVDKLTFNHLPNHWCGLIAAGQQNAFYVSDHFARHPDPLTGPRVAEAFKARYRVLKQEGLGPGEIMDSLYEQVTGVGAVPPRRQVAAQAILAHLFESCDIFEGMPPSVSA